MLRSVLVGVLAAAAVVSCKSSKGDAPAVAASAPAGKVVEITGKVEATRADKTRELAVGAEVFGDDQIATAPDANVTIELFHNGARWSVVSNKKARVDTSLAWGLDKQEASKAVEHHSAAAGRNAERSAADTGATAVDEKKQAESMPAPAAPTAEPAMEEAADSAAPPPPPPPPPPAPRRSEQKLEATRSSIGAGIGTKGKAGGALPPAKAKKDMLAGAADADTSASGRVKALVQSRRGALRKCLDVFSAARPEYTFRVKVVAGTPTVMFAGAVDDKLRACVDGVIKTIDFATLDGTATIDVR